jgi:hypothetical protein
MRMWAWKSEERNGKVNGKVNTRKRENVMEERYLMVFKFYTDYAVACSLKTRTV